MSGDATTLRGIAYESRHSTLLLPAPPQGHPPAEGSTEADNQSAKTGNG